MKTIRITQYLRPSGHKAMIYAEVPDELAELAGTLSISAELVTPTKVMIYAHRKGESEEDELTEIADNGPGDNDPPQALIRLIKRFEKR